MSSETDTQAVRGMSECEWRFWPFVRRLRPVRLLLAAAAIWFAVATQIKANREREACENPPVIARQTSPDGTWEATVVEAICHFAPAAGMTTITASVRLVSTRASSPVGRILAVDTGGRDYNRPFLTWTAPKTLRVVTSRPPFEVTELDFAGMHVDLHVDPDDPAIQAAVAEWRRGAGLSPGPDRKDEAR